MEVVKLNKSLLMGTLASAVALQSGVIFKNTVGKMDSSNYTAQMKSVSTIVGVSLFVLGWYGIAHYTVKANMDSPKRGLIWVAVAGIVGSLLATMLLGHMFSDTVKKILMLVGFVGGWLAFGYLAGDGIGTSRVLTMATALLVLVSMVIILPMQRAEGNVLGWMPVPRSDRIVDGPGYPMFALAWFLLALSNGWINASDSASLLPLF